MKPSMQLAGLRRSLKMGIVLPAMMLLTIGASCAQEPDRWHHPTFSSNDDGVLKQDLYVQFATANVTGAIDPDTGKPINKIWTRAYGTEKGSNLIPGPFYVFHPGDLLDVTMRNLLNEENYAQLTDFENAVDPSFDTDEIIMHIKSEINVPHNPNNTNLHTHGLHVDPSRDDVDVVVAPEGDESHYQHNVSDQPVKRGSWRYVYRIPNAHLPGTHWFHAHKHGSTSIHVENGMAGLLALKPNSAERAIAPALWTKSGFSPHDRPMVLQEIANYAGGAQGPGKSLTDKDTGGAAAGKAKLKAAKAGPDITINGVHQPELTLQPGRVERWRVVNAGANHRTFSYIWLGKVLERDATGNPKKVQEIPFHLVAIDGVTLKKKETMSAQRPVFLAPGNRADLLVQIAESGTDYALFKNFPPYSVPGLKPESKPRPKPLVVVDKELKPITPITDGGITNPYGFSEVTAGTPNFSNLQVNWFDIDKKLIAGKSPVTPLLRVRQVKLDGQTLLDVDHDNDFPNGRWQPVVHNGGGVFDSQLLVNITVAGDAVDDTLPSDDHLTTISPTGSGVKLIKNQKGDAGIPAYVSPITNSDIVQSRTAIFDLSGFTAEVFNQKNPDNTVQIVKQFSLNGRQFSVPDFIGNQDAESLIQELPSLPNLPSESTIGVRLNPVESKSKAYQNTYWMNPGYYSDVAGSEDAGYLYASTDVVPTFENLTGLQDVALVNTGRDRLPDNIPGPPVATTAESWILINNSDIGHPFHIHISPFFVTEVGQLSYVDGKWGLDTINHENKTTHAMGWVVDNWWDTILIPPHGYIKFNAWMNVPQQSPHAEDDMNATTVEEQTNLNKALKNPASITVKDNVNRDGAWVYHCHILRHEDRGMMMTVRTQPNSLIPVHKPAARSTASE